MATKKKAAPPPKRSAKPAPKKSKSPTEARSSKGSDKDESKPKGISVNTPIGRFSYPHFSEPDTVSRGDYKADNKYKGGLLVDKKVWKADPAADALKAAVLKAAQKKWGKDEIQSLKDLDHVPFKDTDSGQRKVSEKTKGCILITAKSLYPPTFIGPKKNEDGEFDELSEKQVEAIKGGDWGRYRVGIATFTLKGERGVNLYLNLVQYQQEGESLGDGASAAVNAMDEMEVTLDDYEDEDGDEDEDEDEKPAKKSSKRKSKARDEEEEDEDDGDEDADSDSDSDDDEDEEEEKPRRSKSRRSRDEDEDEDEEEDERPRRRSNGKDTHYEF